MQLSVTRGLVQLKRLEQRINKKITDLGMYCTANKKNSKKVLDGVFTKDEYSQMAKSSFDSLNDLINLRKEIKDAIVKSNATTTVDICGKKYTVAQAIERKKSIEEFEMHMIKVISKSFSTATDRVRVFNDRVEADAQRLFGTSSEDKKAEVNRLEMMNMYIETNSYEIIDPLNFNSLKDIMLKEAEDFLSEVDQVLSESNAITMIEISKNPSEIQ